MDIHILVYAKTQNGPNNGPSYAFQMPIRPNSAELHAAHIP